MGIDLSEIVWNIVGVAGFLFGLWVMFAGHDDEPKPPRRRRRSTYPGYANWRSDFERRQ